jgi:hypothetical protein
LQLARRFRIPAIFCALAVLLCELISRPYTTMGVGDDGPYILMARTLADTGHIVYNGWGAAMIVAQLYLAAAFIKLFGFSFTTVRMSTLLIAVVTAFVIQRTLVRSSITERNATIGTLALVLSPLYLMLSATFMSDIFGLFAIVICLYGCLRALQSTTDRCTIAWLCFAVATNVLFGTSRQIAWLGTFLMVPCTLWLLRSRHRVLIAGAATNVAGALVIFLCMQWLQHQRYIIPLPLFVPNFPWGHAFGQLGLLLLNTPFLLLPIFALFLPEVRKSRPWVIAILSFSLIGYLVLANYPSHLRGFFSQLLIPIAGLGNWVTMYGIIQVFILPGNLPVFLSPIARTIITFVTVGGFFGLVLSLLSARRSPVAATPSTFSSWMQLGFLLAPFSGAYCLLLFLTAGTSTLIYDRYTLGLLVAALPCLVRFYQERVHPQLPPVTILLIAIMGVYGVAVTHDTFSLDRARVALAHELQASGLPDTALNGSWEANLDVELRHVDHINNPLLKTPENGYTLVAPPAPGPCELSWYQKTPHVHPLYSVSFDPDACYGPAPFAPVHYSRWPYRTPGTLYVVRYVPSPKP